MALGDPGVNFNIGNQTWQPYTPADWQLPYQVPPKRCTCKTCPCCGGLIPVEPQYGQLRWYS